MHRPSSHACPQQYGVDQTGRPARRGWLQSRWPAPRRWRKHPKSNAVRPNQVFKARTSSADCDAPNQSDHQRHVIHLPQWAHVDAALLDHLVATNPLPMTTVPHPTDQASACAAECATTRPVPNHKATGNPAFTWAALATPSVITLSNANDSTAIESDSHATSGYTSPSTASPPLCF